MEFSDECESRPRFLFRSNHHAFDSNQSPNECHSFSSLHKPTLFVSISLSILILFLTFLYFNSEPFKSLLLWLSMSLLLGPFAPIPITGGDIRVGHGPHLADQTILEKSDLAIIETNRKSNRPFKKSPCGDGPVSGKSNSTTTKDGDEPARNESTKPAISRHTEEGKFDEDWTDFDEDLLKKLMLKHAVGKPGRWEAIAEGLKGRYRTENVIAKSKELGEKKASDQDSYQKFLKNRKVIDRHILDDDSSSNNDDNNKVGFNLDQRTKDRGNNDNNNAWSSEEDLALLNALKAFPKEVNMRWEKITAAVPGKTKAACMKRVAELKKDFRSSKASSSRIGS